MQLWADIVQDQSYTFDNVFPYFKKTANFTAPDPTLRAQNATVLLDRGDFDASGEPLHVSYSNFAMPFSSWMRYGLEAVGIYESNGFNNGLVNGSQYTSSTIRPSDQSRSSSETAFFQSPAAKSRLRTLRVYTFALAKRIRFDAQKRATAVEVKTAGSEYTLNASREVIVSAGAFQSPQLLMVSGIGPVDILEDNDIQVISSLPGVGQNLLDHVFFGPSYQVALETFTKLATDSFFLADHLLRYLTNCTGMLTNPVTDYLAFEKLPKSLRSGFTARTEEELSWFPADWPELEVCIHITL